MGKKRVSEEKAEYKPKEKPEGMQNHFQCSCNTATLMERKLMIGESFYAIPANYS